MPKGPYVSPQEVVKIQKLLMEGMHYTKIAKKLKRSIVTVLRVKNGSIQPNNPNRKKPGPKGKLTKRLERNIIQNAIKDPGLSLKKLQHMANNCVSKATIRRILIKNNMKSQKCTKKPPLSDQYRINRFHFAHDLVTGRADLTNVLWSDEKKFNLDGPDGNRMLWKKNDRDYEKFILKKRQNGGPSVMVWGGFMNTVMAPLVVMKGKFDSQAYINMFQEHVQPWIDNLEIQPTVFQQDNAPIHVSHLSRQAFKDMGIELLEWPARSPDLNPVETIWAELSRVVYQGNKQYDNVKDLEAAIQHYYVKLSSGFLTDILADTWKRLVNTVTNKGGYSEDSRKTKQLLSQKSTLHV